MSERKKITIDVCTKEMVYELLKWIRTSNTAANEVFNNHITKEDGTIFTEKEIVDAFIEERKLTSKKFPLGYSILDNTEN